MYPQSNIWPPVLACIVILLAMAYCAEAYAFCLKDVDGNVYTDQTAEEMFVGVAQAEREGRPLTAADFRLKKGSCAIDMGATLSVVTHDFDGNKRPKGKAYDIGAFEFVPSGPTVPKGLRIN